MQFGSFSLTAALKAYGGIKRIAFLTPYYPIANIEVRKYFTDEGFEVLRDVALQAQSWTGIAEITPAMLRNTVKEIDRPECRRHRPIGNQLQHGPGRRRSRDVSGKAGACRQCSDLLHMSLRTNGINDKVCGLGRLLEEF